MSLFSSPCQAHYFLWKVYTSYWNLSHTNPKMAQSQKSRIQTQTNLEESPIHYFLRDWKLHSISTPATNPNIQKFLCMSVWCYSLTNCTLNKSSLSFISCYHFFASQHWIWYAFFSLSSMIFSKIITLSHLQHFISIHQNKSCRLQIHP